MLIALAARPDRCRSIRLHWSLVLVLSVGLLLPMRPGCADGGLFNAEGYRIERYRAPVPESVAGGRVIDVPGLQALMADAAPVLIDVFAALRRPADDSLETVWLVPRPRLSLPGAVWLPNVGYGALDPSLEDYFRDNLQRLTHGDLDRPLVLFCVTDCWMSWNAVKRAHAYGYRNLYWFRDGTDVWRASGLTLRPVTAVPLSTDNEP